ncbi:ribosomal protein L1p/L10e family-domain-containing protein [Catenaria anguillulae PL171]|uniref:Ribosomal protein L1p/L10e family-domain-containing protein n=1 Tax=Catenaria anguillulae PL171 TaxID=765915 RepID=A0A1Y2HSF8_9FUNG|nr:ribosomal protein L1p/L10e family-domain-containing protein [Catenaria anguillulae PL171]
MTTAISQPHALKAISALAKYHDTKADSELIEDEGAIHLVVSLSKIPRAKPGKHRFVRLSHAYRAPVGTAGGPTVCLLVKDPQSDIKQLLAARGVKVSKVLGISKLRTKYATYEAKRDLAKEFDVFLADDRIVPMLTKALGKRFMTPRKLPVPVNVAKLTQAKINLALQSSYYSVPTGTMTDVHVGQVVGMQPEHIVANAMDAVSALTAALPKRCNGFECVQTLAFRMQGTPALPFYNALPKVASDAQLEAAEKAKLKEGKAPGSKMSKRQKMWEEMVAEVQESDDESDEDAEMREASASDEEESDDDAMEA